MTKPTIKVKPTAEDYLSKLNKDTKYFVLDENYIEQQEASINYRPSLTLRPMINRTLPLELPRHIVESGVDSVLDRDKLMGLIGTVRPNEVQVDISQDINLLDALNRIQANAQAIENNVLNLGLLESNQENQKQRIDGLVVTQGNIQGSIANIDTAIIENNRSVLQRINTMQTQVNQDITTKIQEIRQTVSERTSAQGLVIDAINTRLGNTSSQVRELSQSHSELMQTTAQNIKQIESSIQAGNTELSAKIGEESATRATLLESLSQKLTVLESKHKSNSAKITQVQNSVSQGDRSLTEQLSQLASRVDGFSAQAQANLNEHKLAQATINTANAKSVQDINTKIRDNTSSIQNIQEATTTNRTAIVEAENRLSAQVQSAQREAVANLDDYKRINNTQFDSFAQRLSSLDSAYKISDRDLQSKIAQEAATRASAIKSQADRTTSIETLMNRSNTQTLAKINALEQANVTINGSIANTRNDLIAKYNSLDVRTKWQEISSAKDLNTLVLLGNYYLKVNNNPNAPITTPIYVMVDVVNSNKITQIAWSDSNVKERYVRIKYNTTWSAWEKQANHTDITSVISNINEFKQTQATKDRATTQKIDTAISEYQRADANLQNTLQNNINAEQQARLQAFSTLSSRIQEEENTRASADRANAEKSSALEAKLRTVENNIQTVQSNVTSLQQADVTHTQALATAKTHLNAKFDNLSIGGRNLLRDTTSTYNTFTTKATYTNTNNTPRIVVTSLGHSGIFNTTKSTHALKSGEKAVLSFEYRTDMPNLSYTYILADSGNWQVTPRPSIVHNGTWQKAVWLFTAPRDLTNIRALVGGTSVPVNSYLEVRNFKVERGVVATDWIPAHEDMEYNLTNTHNLANDALNRANSANANIVTESEARSNADTTLAQRISNLDSTYQSINRQTVSKLNQLEESISSKDSAMARRVDNLQAEYTTLDNRTRWKELTTVQDLNNLTTQGNYFIRIGNNTNAPHNSWLYVIVDTPRSDRITQTAWADNNPSLRYVRTRSGTTWQGWQKQATGAELDTKASTASLSAEQKARASADTALTQRLDSLQSTVNGNKSSIDTQLQTLSDKDKTQAQKLSQLESGLNGKANATALNELTTKVNQVDGKMTSESTKLTQLISRVGSSEAKINQQLQVINGMQSKFSLKLEAGNKIAGIETLAGRNVSELNFIAEKVKFTSGSSTVTPFILQGGKVTISNALIANGSIKMLHIADSIQSDNFVAGRSGWRLYKNGSIEINSSFNDGTKLQINSQGMTVWYENGKKAVELGIFT